MGSAARRVILAALFISGGIACGGDKSSPTAPTAATPPTPAPSPTPTPTPAIERVTVFGVITNANTGAPVGGVTVTATSAATQTNAQSVSDGNGYYSFPGIGKGTVTIEYRAAGGFNAHTERPTIASDTRLDVRLTPFWRHSGRGNTVFDMPTYVQRVRITGSYPSNSSNFIVRIGGRLVINELLGYGWGSTTYNGLHLTTGGIVEITNSRDVEWSFTQEQ